MTNAERKTVEIGGVEWDVIHTYTRAEAIEDGVLIDVTETAKEAGFRYPVAITTAVYAEHVRVPKKLEGLQDEAGRLWDILWMLLWAIKGARRDILTELPFQLHVAQANGRTILVDLKAHCGPGDDGKPVITVMLPDED